MLPLGEGMLSFGGDTLRLVGDWLTLRGGVLPLVCAA